MQQKSMVHLLQCLRCFHLVCRMSMLHKLPLGRLKQQMERFTWNWWCPRLKCCMVFGAFWKNLVTAMKATIFELCFLMRFCSRCPFHLDTYNDQLFLFVFIFMAVVNNYLLFLTLICASLKFYRPMHISYCSQITIHLRTKILMFSSLLHS